ncbi:hypothetical protein NM688_g33 [Phlebia brevispora]|uniref:Uncharacterized protein n=1 Tax=Phlebia brevispora TaxID=194682 RepID=A0ACC1TFI8_9APHY|nr:hypothetical protein NM688_g33 [Phlebia brevispora]
MERRWYPTVEIMNTQPSREDDRENDYEQEACRTVEAVADVLRYMQSVGNLSLSCNCAGEYLHGFPCTPVPPNGAQTLIRTPNRIDRRLENTIFPSINSVKVHSTRNGSRVDLNTLLDVAVIQAEWRHPVSELHVCCAKNSRLYFSLELLESKLEEFATGMTTCADKEDRKHR